jgi:hypothetical protein
MRRTNRAVEAAVSAACLNAGGTPATTAELLQHDRLLILAEFLESGIGVQRIAESITPWER